MSTGLRHPTAPGPGTDPSPEAPPVLEAPALDDRYRLHRRFDRMGRLVGDSGMERLFRAHAMVVGLGGVGSFAAEGLARSGVGTLTLVDFDQVCVTNANRQLHALKGTVGRPKAEVMAERMRAINPAALVFAREQFYSASTSDDLLSEAPDVVIDAIDNLTAKAHLVAACRARGLPLVVCTGASGRMDPMRIKTADLAETRVDPLARELRAMLRKHHGFPDEGPFGVPAVYTDEAPREPVDLGYDRGLGFRCVCPGGDNGLHTCDRRNRIYGTAGFVTGALGLAAASLAVRALLGED